MICVLNKLFTVNKIFQSQRKTLFKRFLNNFSRQVQNMASNDDYCADIVWIDLEMTGLDEDKDKILELSCIITDENLNVKAEGPSLCINHSEDVFLYMNDWCMKNHYKSGLVQSCRESKITNDKCEQLLLDFLKKNIPKGKCPLAGNSVYMDRLFLRKWMPSVDDYMHYRIIDVSTIKELARRWNPPLLSCVEKKRFKHRSLEDIYDSIYELQFYRKTFFKTLSTNDAEKV